MPDSAESAAADAHDNDVSRDLEYIMEMGPADPGAQAKKKAKRTHVAREGTGRVDHLQQWNAFYAAYPHDPSIAAKDRKAAAAAAWKLEKHGKNKNPATAVHVGCSKCRYSASGCSKCR